MSDMNDEVRLRRHTSDRSVRVLAQDELDARRRRPAHRYASLICVANEGDTRSAFDASGKRATERRRALRITANVAIAVLCIVVLGAFLHH